MHACSIRFSNTSNSKKTLSDLRLLIVVEEAHLWTSKDVPKDAVRFLDSAVRLLRKKGVGVMLGFTEDQRL